MHQADSASRHDSIDLLRGAVMVLMVLDHTRRYLHSASQHVSPTDLSEATAALFLTRWATHIVAPVFVFLAGTGAYLQLSKGKPLGEVSRVLWTRGLWLIFLEFTAVRLGIQFHLDYGTFFGSMQVIWIIGVSMIILAGLVYLPLPATAAISLALIFGHNLLDGVRVTSWRGPGGPAPELGEILWLVLHQPGRFLFCEYPCPQVRVTYPLVPWVGVMGAGFASGWLFRLGEERRRRLLLGLGAAAVLAFLVLRGFNLYGDPAPWAAQENPIRTALSFINTTKYPASLLFLLMTLGPALLALAWFERIQPGSVGRTLVLFGRVPLFFYLLQFYVVHGLAVIAGAAAGQPVSFLYTPGRRRPDGAGFDLWAVYLFWAAGMLLLYPPCRWFAGVKRGYRRWWLSYL